MDSLMATTKRRRGPQHVINCYMHITSLVEYGLNVLLEGRRHICCSETPRRHPLDWKILQLVQNERERNPLASFPLSVHACARQLFYKMVVHSTSLLLLTRSSNLCLMLQGKIRNNLKIML